MGIVGRRCELTNREREREIGRKGRSVGHTEIIM